MASKAKEAAPPPAPATAAHISKKSRFTPLDCVAIVQSLTGNTSSNLIGAKVLNIYDLEGGGGEFRCTTPFPSVPR
jgi:predicted cobalt transporter CbtA